MLRPPKLTLVLGGVRSGKSAFAEKLAAELNHPILYLATGQAGDAEMAERIRRHQQRRPADWRTVEEPLHPAAALAATLSNTDPPPALLLDSLDVWVANLILADETADFNAVEAAALAQLEALLTVCRRQTPAAILVSSEVGLSPVPDNALARRFQDLLGTVNQQTAAAADAVYLIVAGLPLPLKTPEPPRPGFFTRIKQALG